MIEGKKITVVLPAYNAEKTLERTFSEIPLGIVDAIILTDDSSSDRTVEIARKLRITDILRHEKNRGYGANQKTCYDKALEIGSDIIIMLHPDYQYTPRLIPSMTYLISSGLYDVVLGSRILNNGALKGNMPYFRYFFNRVLTFIQNILMNQKLSEYHTGYRAYRREVLESINYRTNSDDFVFDNQVLSQILYKGYNVGEISCPTKYFPEASSINFRRSIVYGFGVLQTSLLYFLSKTRVYRSGLFR